MTADKKDISKLERRVESGAGKVNRLLYMAIIERVIIENSRAARVLKVFQRSTRKPCQLLSNIYVTGKRSPSIFLYQCDDHQVVYEFYIF